MKKMSKKSIALLLVFVLIVPLTVSCGNKNDEGNNTEQEKKTEGYKGKYKGEAKGFGGDIKVEVELDSEGKILSVSVNKDNNETEGIGKAAIEKLPDEIVKAQGTNIDAVSGATKTSEAVFSAVESALKSAGLNSED